MNESTIPKDDADQLLDKHLQNRPNRNSLVHSNILKGFRADPRLHDAMRELTRTRRVSQLSRLLNRRRSVKDLIKANIMLDQDEQQQQQQENGNDANFISPDLYLKSFLANRPSFAEVARLNLFEDTMTWQRMLNAGTQPLPRNCAAFTSVGDKLYLTGGYGPGYRCSELFVFDTINEHWTRPLVSGMLLGYRFSHSSVAAGKQIIIFGGCTEDGQWLNETHVLDTESPAPLSQSIAHLQWAQQCIPQTVLMFYQPETAGDVPCARAAHSATMIGCRMIVFGGNDGYRLFNDLHVLHTDTMIWSCIEARGNVPCARAGHASCAIDDTRLVVFGGGASDGPLNDLYVLDTLTDDDGTMRWSLLSMYGSPPAPRIGHSMHVVLGTKLIVFGGGTIDKVYDDLHIYDIDSCTWSRPSDSGTLPAPRTGHASCLHSNYLFVFGGANVDGDIFNDLHALDCDFLNLSAMIDSNQGLSESDSNVIDTPGARTRLVQQVGASRSRIKLLLNSMKSKVDQGAMNVAVRGQSMQQYIQDSLSSLRTDIDTLSSMVLEELAELEANASEPSAMAVKINSLNSQVTQDSSEKTREAISDDVILSSENDVVHDTGEPDIM